ncbi:MAG: DUF6440 family protein [Clostridiales bacterium]|nr:DUF6440 family protein [Clostridiales bacterium]MCC8098847.1 DUF6440 family protein [Clostridiales bacterium]
MAKKEKRFERVYKEGSDLTTGVDILVDKTTRIQYLMVSSGYAMGVTPLLDSEGKPLLWKPEPQEPAWND